MTRYKSGPQQETGESDVLRKKIAAALDCVILMCPQLDARGKRRMVKAILTLGDGKERANSQRHITGPQIVEMVWRHSQCVDPHCPLLLFGGELAQELNEFFQEDE